MAKVLLFQLWGSQQVPQVCTYNIICLSQTNSLEIKQQRLAEEDSELFVEVSLPVSL